MRKLFITLLVCVMSLIACASIDIQTKHFEGEVCYYGVVNPRDLTDISQYELVTQDGKPAALNGPNFIIVGFHAKSEKAQAKHVLAIVTPNGIQGICYKVCGKWYPFSFDSKERCYTYDGEEAVTQEASDILDKMEMKIFGEVSC